MSRFVLALLLLLAAVDMFRRAVKILRGTFPDIPVFRGLDMTRKKPIARFYFVTTGVFGANLLFLASQVALIDSTHLLKWRMFQFLLVAIACIIASNVVGRYWFRRQ